jgi:hypothetical protein
MSDRSIFDGYSLTLYRPDGSVVGSWPAISGRPGFQRPSDQNSPFKGPLTEGRYSFSTSDIQPMRVLDMMTGLVPGHRGRFPGSMPAWGTERVSLVPSFAPTNGRNNFFIHGGVTPGSAGCIDLGPNEKVYFDALRSTGEPDHDVIVRYHPNLETSPHPLAGKSAWNDIGEYFTRPLPGLLTPFEDSPSIADRFGSWIFPADRTAQRIAERRASSPQAGGEPESDDGAPVRRLGRRVADGRQASVFEAGAPAVPSFPRNDALSPGHPVSLGDRFGNWTALPAGGISPLNPNLPPPPETDRPLGIVSGQPIPQWVTPPPIFGRRDRFEAPVDEGGDWLMRMIRSAGNY